MYTARVTLVYICVCLSMAILALQAMGQLMNNTSGFRTTRSDFPEMTAFRRYGEGIKPADNVYTTK